MISTYSPLLILVVLLLFQSPVSAQEVDARDLQSIEGYALSLYDQAQYRQAQQLLEEVVRNGESRSMRDRARYNSALAAYQQGKLSKALETLESMENPNPQSIHNAQYIKKEMEQRRKNESQSPPQQEEQEQQGNGESSSPQEGEQGDSQQEDSQQESSQKGDSKQESKDSQNEEEKENPDQGGRSGEDGQESTGEGIPQEALSPEEWSKREAERLLDSIEEGEHRGFGQDGETSSGTKTW